MKLSNPSNVEINVELYYDLDRDEEYNHLVIRGKKRHHAFDKTASEGGPHTITWTLTGNAAGGRFCALDDLDNPGFTWLIRKPTGRIFRDLRAEGKHRISIHNHHHDKHSEGMWHYQLFAKFGNKVFGVPLTFGCGHSSNPNPTIKNT
ncbi:hypothetical protein [Dyella sp. C11]|uniref:hypothetical protein n=1 Tax=Dyella sp. C11 TaxID=2126991 RepID=UPI000D65C03B|nr:hypothetical protein [Dyella sp. C11]